MKLICQRTSGIALLFGLLALLLPACSQEDSSTRYAIKALSISSRLTTAGEEWGKTMQPWFLGQAVDIEQVARTEAECERKIRQIRNEIQQLSVPNNAQSKQFAHSLEKYLDWQIKVGLVVLSEATAAARQENPATEQTRQRVIDKLLKLNDQELAWKAKLNDLARAMGVTIVNKAT